MQGRLPLFEFRERLLIDVAVYSIQSVQVCYTCWLFQLGFLVHDENFICNIIVASVSRLSPSKRTNCSVTFDPPVRKGGRARGPGRSHHVMLAARDVASYSAC